MAKRILNPCTIKGHPVFVAIEDDRKKLSFTGVVGPRSNGDAWGSCGQIRGELISPDAIPCEGWTKGSLRELHDLWERWHLNNMRPGCEHQREWPISKELSVQEYTTVGTNFDDFQVLVKRGRATKEEQDLAKRAETLFDDLLMGKSTPYPESEIKQLVEANLLAPSKIEIKRAGWVYPNQHPEGLLTKPCPVCGYKYGSSWLFEPVPDEVIKRLNEMPETTAQPAWV